MRILLYGLNFAPELIGVGKYTGELAAWLAGRGHEVRVVTGHPYYPKWEIWDGHDGGVYRTEIAPNLKVYRCPLYVPSNPTAPRRLLHLFSFAVSSLPMMLRQAFWKPHLVWGVEPTFLCAPTSLLVARLSGAWSWWHVQDFEIEAALGLGFVRRGLVSDTVLKIRSKILRLFDRVSTISPRMECLLHEKGVKAERTFSIVNWADPGLFDRTDDASKSMRLKLKIPEGDIVALYSGNMGAKQGLFILAEAAFDLQREKRIHFVFCGNGAARRDMEDRCTDLENVHFLDLQPAEHLGSLLKMADIHLLPQRADAADLVMPSKLAGMLASGRPVVATADLGTEIANLVHGCGCVVPPGDRKAFVDAIRFLAANADVRHSLGAAGSQYSRKYLEINSILSEFEKEILSLTEPNKF